MQRILKYTAIIMLFGIATVAFGAEAEGEDEELALPEDKGIVKAVIHVSPLFRMFKFSLQPSLTQLVY